MFEIPKDVEERWSKQRAEVTARGTPRVARFTDAEIADIESLFGQSLPDDYKQFVRSFGGAVFYDNTAEDVEAIPYRFIYTYKTGDFSKDFEGVISAINPPKTITDAHKYMIDDPDNETETSFFPPNMLPFAGDLEQNYLLLELGTDTPRVWFWEDKPDAWGQEDNTLVGFVAESFAAFINMVMKR